jgi:hypothetical protein
VVFEDHGVPRLAEDPVDQARLDGLHGLTAGRGDHHSLSRGQPIGLHHVGRLEGVKVHDRRRHVREGLGAGRRDPVPDAELLGPGLGALDPGRGGRGAERAKPPLGQGVDESDGQWRLGAYHDEVDPLPAGQLDEPGHV